MTIAFSRRRSRSSNQQTESSCAVAFPSARPCFLEASEAERLLELHLLKNIWRRLFATALFTGLRKGELLGAEENRRIPGASAASGCALLRSRNDEEKPASVSPARSETTASSVAFSSSVSGVSSSSCDFLVDPLKFLISILPEIVWNGVSDGSSHRITKKFCCWHWTKRNRAIYDESFFIFFDDIQTFEFVTLNFPLPPQ